MPNIDPRTLAKAMKKMGVQQTEIPAEEVIIRTGDKEIVISNPSVLKVSMMGQESFQISGEISTRDKTSEDSQLEISDEDIQTVASQSNCSEEEAKEALNNSHGDIAEAILSLKESDKAE